MNESKELAVPTAPLPGLLAPIAQPKDLLAVHEQTTQMIRSALKEGKDYGKIPGTDDKLNLLKPGAERLCAGFGLRPVFETLEAEIDHDRRVEYSLPKWVTRRDPGKPEKERLKALGLGRNRKRGTEWEWQEKENEEGVSLGLYRYVVRCRLFRGETEVGQGVGSCSSMEAKYIRAPRDAENTVLKMAKKRAFVDATLTTLGLSDRLTQDIEDQDAPQVMDAEPEPVAAPHPPAEPETAKEVLAALGLTPEQTEELKAKLKARGLRLSEWIVPTYKAGARGFADLLRRVAQIEGQGEDDVQDAEIVEEADGRPVPSGKTAFGRIPTRWFQAREALRGPTAEKMAELATAAIEAGFPAESAPLLAVRLWLEYGMPKDQAKSLGAVELGIEFLTRSAPEWLDKLAAELELEREVAA